VFKSICAGFNVTPSVCYDELIPGGSGRISAKMVVWIILGAILINVILIYCYRRYSQRELKEEMHLQISSMMSQYFALTDTNKERETQISVKP